METVELVGFLVFTLAAAGLIIGFLYSIDFQGIQNTFSSIITPQEDFSNLQKVDYVGLIKKIESCTKEGEYASESVDCGNLLLTNEGISTDYAAGLNKEFFNKKFLELSFCTDCNLELPGLIMPNTIVHLSYNQESGQIKLSGLFDMPSDVLPPITALSGCEGGTSPTNTTLTLSCSDSSQGTGCNGLPKYKIDDGTEKSGKTITLTQKDDDHNYKVNYYSTDNNNNQETEQIFYCKLDALPITPDVTPPATSFSGCSSSYSANEMVDENKLINLGCTDNNPLGKNDTITGCKDINYRFYKDGDTPGDWVTIQDATATSFLITQTTIDTNYVVEYNSIDHNNNLELIKTNYCAVRKIYVAPAICFSSGGNGTDLPYKVSSCFDLNCIRNNTGDKNYDLIKDIDCSGTINWNDGNGFLPLPTLSSNSVFNGNNHKINNLYITPATTAYQYIGLFSELNGTIKNLTLQNITLKSNYGSAYMGSFTGHNSYGKITDCTANGTIYDYGYYIGGIIGYNQYGTITNTNTDLNIVEKSGASPNSFGGIIGYTLYGTITNSKTKLDIHLNSGSITYLGGIVGYNYYGTIKNTFSDLNVFLNTSFSATSLGGGVGWFRYGKIENSYSTGTIKLLGSASNKAGFIGNYSGGDVNRTYSAIDLNFVSGGNGFINSTNSSITKSFWDINLSTIKASSGGIAKSTTEMKTKSNFIDANWSELDWTLCDGEYPSLKWEGFSCSSTPSPLISVSGISASQTTTPQTISVACTAIGGCQKIEYQIADGAWISNPNPFTTNPTTDTNVKITIKATDNTGTTDTKTFYSAVTAQTTENSTQVMTGVILGGGSTPSIIGGGNGYAITNFATGSNFSGFNSGSVQANSCEFMIDNSQVWIKGLTNTDNCKMTPINISKNDTLNFIVKLRAKDTAGKYIQSPTIHAQINTTGGGASISLTPTP